MTMATGLNIALPVPEFDPRERPWYIAAKEAGTAIWGNYLQLCRKTLVLPSRRLYHYMMRPVSYKVWLAPI